MKRWLHIVWVWLALLVLPGCGTNPEELLAARWSEVAWTYEKLDRLPERQRFDGISIDAFEEHRLVYHEAEYWHFRPDRSFVIALGDGSSRHGRWRLKGRGHILTLRYADGNVEVYDVKELDEQRMVLTVDLGMEVRGIARLDFSRMGSGEPKRHASKLQPHRHAPLRACALTPLCKATPS